MRPLHRENVNFKKRLLLTITKISAPSMPLIELIELLKALLILLTSYNFSETIKKLSQNLILIC